MQKFNITSKTLNEALTMLSKVLANKNTLSILDCVVFRLNGQTLTLMAADAENNMRTEILVAETEGDGTFAVNAKDITEAVRNLTEQELTFCAEEDTRVKVSYQGGYFYLPTVNAIEFPDMPELNDKETAGFTIAEGLLRENIGRTLFATAQDDLRPVMNGIFFDYGKDSLNIVASDGHQLVRNMLYDIKAGEDGTCSSFILPKKPAAILKANLSNTMEEVVNITFDNRQAMMVTDRFTLTCRLVEGRYPNYNGVIPKENPIALSVDRLAMIAALKRITPFSNTASNLVKVHIENGMMQLEAEDYEFSKSAVEKVACEYIGDSMDIGFKGVAVIEILDNIKTEVIEIQLTDATRPAIVMPAEQPENQNVLMLQMPMLINY